MPESIKTKQEIIDILDELIKAAEYNGDTRAVLDDQYSLRLRLPRSQDIEKVIRDKKKPKTATASNSTGPGKFYGVEDFQKKIENLPITEPPSAKPAEGAQSNEIPESRPEESNDQKAIDLYADGMEAAKKKYKKVDKFNKAVHDLGLQIEGSDWESAWASFDEIINGIK